MSDLNSLLSRAAADHGDRPAVRLDDLVLTYSQLHDAAGRVTAAGSCLTLLPRFDAGKALDIFGRDTVTIFAGVPTMYAAMLHHRSAATADTSSLRTCISGGASMPLEIMRGFE
jgi:acyl-CoA synthetase (AMP-forming)/AMP-acid ligase II